MPTTTNAVGPFGVAGSRLTGNGLTTLPTMKGGNATFLAYCSTNQSIASVTYTKIAMDTVVLNTSGAMYDATTNYRFTPTIAGYYLIIVQTAYNGNLATDKISTASIYKNGTLYNVCQTTCPTNNDYNFSTVTGFVYMNGSTDYVEAWTIQTDVVSRNLLGGSATYTVFSGTLIEAA